LGGADTAATTDEPSFRRTRSAKATTLFQHEMNSKLGANIDESRDIKLLGFRILFSAAFEDFSIPDGIVMISILDG
jgi:hypothetical protein